jgi:type II secretory pathway predicted ATPase ExeA
MGEQYRVFFGLQKEPFCQDIRVEDMMKSESLKAVTKRFDFAVNLASVAVITGDIGSGKSSALRYAASTLHPSEYRIVSVVATSGSIIELYRQIYYALNIETKSTSKAYLTKIIKNGLLEMVKKKQRPVLIVDEASILRLDVLAELHSVIQFEGDSKPVLTMILAGQNNLIDNLMFRQSRPLSSRVVARGHMEASNIDEMGMYLQHHLTIAGCKQNIFSEQAVTAIQQGSGGLLRKANNLARGALVAAASEKCSVVSAEHVRLAATELF